MPLDVPGSAAKHHSAIDIQSTPMGIKHTNIHEIQLLCMNIANYKRFHIQM